MILAGDAGGTKVRLALFDQQNGKLAQGRTQTYASADYAGINLIVSEFVNAGAADISAAVIGVPGPIIKGVARATNLPWRASAIDIVAEFGFPKFRLVNDLVATSASLPHLTQTHLVTLNAGEPSEDAEVFTIVAPGTGLGQGFLSRREGRNIPLASEGGHATFAPSSKIEMALSQHLMERFGHVSAERVLSGPGLINIYNFLKVTGRASEPPALRDRLQQEPDEAAVITQAAMAGEFEICEQTLDIFCAALGSHASSMVLTLMATGGVYIGGGIPPKILPKLQDGTVMAAFQKKGRLSEMVAKTPVHVIIDDHTPLLGAASIAAGL